MRLLLCIAFTCFFYASSFNQTNHKASSHYVFSEFIQGSILMKSGHKADYLLNYNSLTEEMIFDRAGQKMAISKNEMEIIDTVFIEERKFVVLNGIFVEMVHQSEWDLFIEHKCELKEVGKPIGYGSSSKTTAITNYSSITLGGDSYKLKLPDIYKIEPGIHYWLRENGRILRFTNMNELRKLYKAKKNLFRSYVKEKGSDYEDVASIIELIKVIESI
jgi:hypothetical protein